MKFKINSKLDTAALAKVYKKQGRVQVFNFLEQKSADALFECLHDNCVWQWTYYDGAEPKTMSGPVVQNMRTRHKTEVMEKVYTQAQHQYQKFLMDCRFGDDENAQPAEKAKNQAGVKEFLHSGALRDAVNAISGGEDQLSDLHATWQARDLFKCDTVDAPDNPKTGAIFMLDLAKDWRPDWGGTLSFPNDDGGFTESWPARFNVLNIIAAPARHSLSYVVPFIDGFRLSLWGRAE